MPPCLDRLCPAPGGEALEIITAAGGGAAEALGEVLAVVGGALAVGEQAADGENAG